MPHEKVVNAPDTFWNGKYSSFTRRKPLFSQLYLLSLKTDLLDRIPQF
jgi:hypothetical protein